MNTIAVKDFELVTVSAAEEARTKRDQLLHFAKSLPLVTDAATQNRATEVLRELRGFYKVIEAGREAAKAPVLKVGRNIDALAADLTEEVEREGKRLSLVLGAYDMEQKRIAEQKRQEALAEERRIREEAARKEREEEERQEKLREQARREVARQQQEIADAAAAKALRARTEAGRERAQKEAEEARQALADKAALEAQERERVAFEAQRARDEEEVRRVAATREQHALAVAARPKDTATSEVINYEVTNIVALYEAAPYLVTLSPNKAAIKSALKGLHGEQQLPGVRHWKEAVTITRNN